MDIQEMKRAETKAWPYLLAGLSGMAAGAALGVLFAPDSGKETRQRVAGWLKEKRTQGKQWIASRRHGGKELPLGV